MNTHEVVDLLHKIGIIPVVKLDRVDDALPLAKALIEGNLPCAEVTFRTDCAPESIRLMSENYPDMLVGAGTVLTKAQVDLAIESGAKFIVSPGLNPEVVNYCIEKEIPIVPGVANASDIELALSLGLEVVKFFPAEINGGLNAINALSGPFPNLKFIPTGGVSTENMNKYLNSNKIVAAGGTWMVKDDLINEGRFDEIAEISRKAVEKMLGFEIAHVGINPTEAEYQDGLTQFSKIFGEAPRETSMSHFVSDHIELMKQGRGKYGHIAIRTHSVERARYFLEKQGFTFDDTTLKHREDGKAQIVYFEKEIAGFAVHLVRG